jgi:hypothetical protein
MKFKPILEVKTIYDDPIKLPGKEEPATLAQLSIEGLLYSDPRETIPMEKKLHRYNLARRLKKAHDARSEELDLPAEDIALIKDCVAKCAPMGVGIAGAVLTAIES